jgi:8-oxo-dGTP diphosphatase
MDREYPAAPMVGVGAVIVDGDCVLLVQRGHEPAKGSWTIPGGLVELGESLEAAAVREAEEETGLKVEVVEVVEVLDRIFRDDDQDDGCVRFHYVIVDYLCRVAGGQLRAGSDAEAARWVERAQWNSHSALQLDPITVRVVEKAWRMARSFQK